MKKPFVYDEKTSSLYGPDGKFIKKIHCPKAVRWNQLIQDSLEDRSRGCNQCNERVLNLDTITPVEASNLLYRRTTKCFHASSNSDNVIFLKDINNPELSLQPDNNSLYSSNEIDPTLPVIRTVRNINDIQRGQQMGFWPDVRLVVYNVTHIRTKISVDQNKITGEIKTRHDFRDFFSDDPYNRDKSYNRDDWEQVIPWSFYYNNYQETPIAAYLIPRDLPNNAKVLVPDPIEDLISSTSNQGNSYRAENVTAQVINRKVIIDPITIQKSQFMG